MEHNDPVEILLVEDNPNDVELAVHAFKKNKIGNGVFVARDGAEALDFIFHTGPFSNRAKEEYPRVILLDLKLPKVDGIEVLRQIKSDVRVRKIPVVIVTSSREEQDIEMCYQLGANSYVVKPVNFDRFIEAVSTLGHYWLNFNQVPTI
jgi:two-component system response regulator